MQWSKDHLGSSLVQRRYAGMISPTCCHSLQMKNRPNTFDSKVYTHTDTLELHLGSDPIHDSGHKECQTVGTQVLRSSSGP